LADDEGKGGGAFLRAIVTGSAVVVLVNALEIYSSYALRSSRLNFGYLPMCTLIPFVLLVFVVCPVVRMVCPRRAFTPAELLIVFSMGLIGAIFPGLGLGSFLIGIIGSPHYYASSENQWAEYLLPYLPKWIAPADTHAVNVVFQGLPEGEQVPYEVWVAPAFWWLLFIGAMFTVALSALVILRKQWVVRERLTYPLAQMPLELIRGTDADRWFPSFTRDRLFWIGFSVPLLVILWNALGYFYPQFPAIPIVRGYPRLRIARAFPVLFTRVNFFVISFAFLTNLDVLFSIWFFHALALAQIGIYNRLGVSVGPASEWSHPWWLVRLQGTGGYIFCACWALWLARKHLADAVRKAWNPAYPVDDENELMPHRWAVIGFIGGLLYIVLWARAAGFSGLLLALYLVTAFLFAVGLAKFLAESGLVYLGWPFSAHQFAVFTIGSANLTPKCLTAAALSDARGIFGIVGFVHIAKLADSMRMNKRSIAKITCLSVFVGCIVAVVFAIYMGYTYGAYNTGHWTYVRGNQYVYTRLVKKLTTPVPIDWAKMSLVGIGILFTAIITFLRYQFTWFNLHPIGFTVATMWPVRTAAVSFFIVWLAKFIIVKIGGAQLQRKAFPFFMGMMLGYSVAVGLSFVVDAIWFPGAGHLVHYW